MWKGDQRLAQLFEDWDANELQNTTKAYQSELRAEAKGLLEDAARRRVSRLIPNLYFRLGKIAMDTGNYPEALAQFAESYRQATAHTSVDIQRELSVRTYHAMGLVYWRMREYSQALPYIQQAETWQQSFGGRWVPDISQHRRRLEGLIR